MQSTFLNAHRALQRGVTPDAELPWLFKIAHNVCLTRRRSRYRRGRVETPSDFDAVQDVVPAPARDSSDELLGLTDALSDMPNNQRRAILLREWQGLSYHEIAAELNVSQSAVETLIFRGRRTLAANLQAESERPKPRLLARARRAVDAGTLLMALKTLFEGGAAVKAAAAAVAVTGTAVAISSTQPNVRPERVAAPDAAHTQHAPVELARAPAPTSPRVVPAQASQPEPTRAARSKPAAQPSRDDVASAVPADPTVEAPPAVAAARVTDDSPAPAVTRPKPARKPAKLRTSAAPAPPAARPSQATSKPKPHELRVPPGQVKKSEPAPTEQQPSAPITADPAVPLDPGHGNGAAKEKEQSDKK